MFRLQKLSKKDNQTVLTILNACMVYVESDTAANSKGQKEHEPITARRSSTSSYNSSNDSHRH